MATGLLARRAPSTIVETSALFRSSFTSFLRNLSTAAPINNSAAESAAAEGGEVQKPKRKKKKNLFEVAQFLPNWGIGYHMAKTHWTGVSYEITKINLYKDGRHGKAWGIVHKDDVSDEIEDLACAVKSAVAADAPKKLSGVHKRCWKYIPNTKKTEANASKQELHTA